MQYNTVMDQATINKLTALNHQFYQSFAEHFSETRQRLQPGVIQVLKNFPPVQNVLDLGCGNGLLAREINRQGKTLQYHGVDFSSDLLENVRKDLSNPQITFQELDFTASGWTQNLPRRNYDAVLCFAALHHVPGKSNRVRLCREIRSVLPDGGYFIHSNWQFLKSPRQKKRILSWDLIDIDQQELDKNDYLLDWRRGGQGMRYVHYFSEQELSSLADQAGFTVMDIFYSDGKEGDLSIYQSWSADPIS